MARVSEVYGGNWLEKEDLGGREVIVTIESITIHEMGDGKRKAAVHFVGKDKALLINVTNATAIEALTGTDEMDAWVGTKICLYSDPTVMFQGRRVGGLRVKAPSAIVRSSPVPRNAPPPPKPPPEPEDNTPDFEDSVPFAWLVPYLMPFIGAAATISAVVS